MGIPSFFSPFHIEFKDAANIQAHVQKQFMWTMVIPNLPIAIDTGVTSYIGPIASLVENIFRTVQLATVCKSINLPKKVIETADVFFLGRKKKVPMNTTYESNTFDVVFEEMESQLIFYTFSRWIDAISNSVSPGMDVSNMLGGLLNINTKNVLGANFSEFKDYTSDMFLFMEMGCGIPNNFINIKKAWPIDIVQTSNLDYSGTGSILYTVTFAFNEYSFISREDIL